MLAILCSGQGTQHADMFRLTGRVPAAEAIFSVGGEMLGEDPRRYVQHAADTELFDNDIAQILCVTQAMAAYLALQPYLPRRLVVAGYSVGELSAWGVAGLLTPEQTVRIAKARAALMTAGSGPHDGLAFIQGLPLEDVQTLAAHHSVDVAIINPNNTTVIGGRQDALVAACTDALASGAERADLLGVQVASHTSRLTAVVPKFLDVLRDAAPRSSRPGVVLLSALRAEPVFNTSAASSALADEISSTLNWKYCLQAAYERGVRVFLEFGPGRALSNMASRTYSGVEARSLDDFRSLDGVVQWTERHAQVD